MNEFKEIPASKRSTSQRKPVFGVGINDASYNLTVVLGDGRVARCPFYSVWIGMLTRVYSDCLKKKYPTYLDCSVCDEWLVFSRFRMWMEAQDWKGKQLDKDIILSGNKKYSPSTCMFVSGKINNLFTNSDSIRGGNPRGVSFIKELGKYKAECSSDGKVKLIGVFSTPAEAESAYCEFKSSLLYELSRCDEAVGNKKLEYCLLASAKEFLNKSIELRKL